MRADRRAKSNSTQSGCKLATLETERRGNGLRLPTTRSSSCAYRKVHLNTHEVELLRPSRRAGMHERPLTGAFVP